MLQSSWSERDQGLNHRLSGPTSTITRGTCIDATFSVQVTALPSSSSSTLIKAISKMFLSVTMTCMPRCQLGLCDCTRLSRRSRITSNGTRTALCSSTLFIPSSIPYSSMAKYRWHFWHLRRVSVPTDSTNSTAHFQTAWLGIRFVERHSPIT